MKEFAESFSSKDELPEDVLSHKTQLEDFPFEEGLAVQTQLEDFPFEEGLAAQTQLEDFPFEEGLAAQTPLEDFPFRDSSPQEMLLQDFSFEYGSLEEAPTQDFSSADNSVGEKLPKDLPSKDDRDKLSKGLLSEEEEEEEDYADSPHIGHSVANAFRAAMQWCDDVANEPNDIFTNFKSQLPFLMVVGGIILLMWIVRFIYG